MSTRRRPLSSPVRALLKLAQGGKFHRATFRIDGPWWSDTGSYAGAGNLLTRLPEALKIFIIQQLEPKKRPTIRLFDFGTNRRPLRCLIGVGPRNGQYDMLGNLIQDGLPHLIKWARGQTKRWSPYQGYGGIVSFIAMLVLGFCAFLSYIEVFHSGNAWEQQAVNLAILVAVAGATATLWARSRIKWNREADTAAKALADLHVQ